MESLDPDELKQEIQERMNVLYRLGHPSTFISVHDGEVTKLTGDQGGRRAAQAAFAASLH